MKQLLTKLIPLTYGKLFNLMVIFNPRATAIKAFKVFCTIRKGRIKDFQKPFLDPAKLKIEIVGEHKIQSYHWEGKGETVMLLHGWESNTYRWRNLIKKLQEEGFNIISFDAPGHGYSSGKLLYVPLYAECTRYMMDNYHPKHIVAHSVGGMTTLYDHYKNSESSVEKIVTIGSPCEFEQFMNHYQSLLKFNSKVREALNQRLKEWFNFYFHEFSSAIFVKNNTKKGLLFHDKNDLQVPYEASVKVQGNWKGSRLISTEGLGHSMYQDEVNEQVIDFLKY